MLDGGGKLCVGAEIVPLVGLRVFGPWEVVDKLLDRLYFGFVFGEWVYFSACGRVELEMALEGCLTGGYSGAVEVSLVWSRGGFVLSFVFTFLLLAAGGGGFRGIFLSYFIGGTFGVEGCGGCYGGWYLVSDLEEAVADDSSLLRDRPGGVARVGVGGVVYLLGFADEGGKLAYNIYM